MAAYGQIKIRQHGARSEEIHTLSFGHKTAFYDTLRYIKKHRLDIEIVDEFWGYALFENEYAARDAINAFAPVNRLTVFGVKNNEAGPC